MDNIDQIVNELLSDESFHRWIFGGASPKEASKWQKWIHESPDHKLAVSEAKALLNKLSFNPMYYTDVDEKWVKLEKHLDSKKRKDFFVSFVNVQSYKRWHIFLRYAAIFLVISLTGTGFWLFTYQNKHKVKDSSSASMIITTRYREQEILRFSDGSKIVLAPNSKLEFKRNWLTKRVKEVRLKGQAYFNIVDKPPYKKVRFKIHTQYGIIKDYGTKFNVSTFGKKTTVVLQSGIVSIISKKRGEHLTARLNPGEMAVISPGMKSIDIQKVDPKVYISWTTSTLYFSGTPLKKFVNDLKNFYGVHVVVRDTSLLSKKLSGGIDRGTLSTMLAVVSRVLKIKMYQTGDTVYVADISEK